MKLLTFAASSSSQSINKQLAIHAASLVEDAEIELPYTRYITPKTVVITPLEV